MLSCLIPLYDFSTPGTNPVLCVLGANQHRQDFKGLCIPVLQSRRHLLRRLVDHIMDMNYMDCGYTLGNLKAQRKYTERSQINAMEHIIFSE